MAECRDKKYKEMLHAYELGLLSDKDRMAFETHLIECDYCFEKVQRMETASRMIRDDSDIRQAVDEAIELEDMAEAQESKEMDSRKAGKTWRRLLPASLVFVVILMVLLLKDWNINIDTSREAVASESRLAIMYFDNLADSSDAGKLSQIAANLLITDLAESHYLQVVSSQRIHDILRLLGEDEKKQIDKDMATAVAKKAGADWVLQGSVVSEQPPIVLTAQLVDVSSGEVIASQQVTGEPEENIFAVVDKLSAEIKADLALPAAAMQEPDRMVADITTHSPEAYRYYLEGMEYVNKFYGNEARQSFRKALEYDSTFAMAYYYLASLTAAAERSAIIAKAVEYSDKASHKEKAYIKVMGQIHAGEYDQAIEELLMLVGRYPDEKDAYYLLGYYKYLRAKYDAAIEYFETVIELDPLYKAAHNMLAYVYNRTGEYEKAIEAINKYISLAPDEPNPYDTRGEIYAHNGELDLAIESYGKALQIKPDFTNSLSNLGILYLFKRDYSRADSCFEALKALGEESTRITGEYYKIYIPVFQGKYEKAIESLSDQIEADTVTRFSRHLVRALLYRETGRYDLALADIRHNMDLREQQVAGDKASYRYLYIQFLAEMGEIERARIHSDTMRSTLEDLDWGLCYYWYSLGAMELAKGNCEQARQHLEEAADKEHSIITHLLLARAYLDCGRYEESIRELKLQLSIYNYQHALYGVWHIKLHYYLGLAYEKSGDRSKAIEQYREYLEYMKDSDSGIPAKDDAVLRLKKLESQS
jgi:tetratricopeptide (TPR) repeat protein